MIYTTDTEAPEVIFQKTKELFGIDLNNTNILFCYLARKKWMEAKTYPVLTLLGQFWGSFLVTEEALRKFPVKVMIDTHGHPGGYFYAKLSGVKVVSYVHYPTISLDMLQRVRELRPSYNNASRIASSVSISKAKVVYYYFLLQAYKAMGYFCDLALCNSNWTFNHINNTWKTHCEVLYPPCDIEAFLKIPIEKNPEPVKLISVGQFRPEKDHELQLQALAKLIQSNHQLSNTKLLLVGSCRNQEDYQRVESIKSLSSKLAIQDNVEFHLNVKFQELLELLGSANVGLHSMWNEHFGICVVEMMAAGLVTLAHNSGGPKYDIITPEQNGFLAGSPEEYAECLEKVILNYSNYSGLRKAARERSKQFSEKAFGKGFTEHIKEFLKI